MEGRSRSAKRALVKIAGLGVRGPAVLPEVRVLADSPGHALQAGALAPRVPAEVAALADRVRSIRRRLAVAQP